VTDNQTPLRVILTDANVLYSRVLRDYLLYAAEHRLISVAWSRAILNEMAEHLIENRPTFTHESATRLIAAALAAEADIVCTANTTDFPSRITDILGLTVATPDNLICQLITDHPTPMLFVHDTSVANLRGATNASTIEALRKAGASRAAEAMETLLSHEARFSAFGLR